MNILNVWRICAAIVPVLAQLALVFVASVIWDISFELLSLVNTQLLPVPCMSHIIHRRRSTNRDNISWIRIYNAYISWCPARNNASR